MGALAALEQWIIGAKIDFPPHINPHHLLSSFFPIETPRPIEITKISPATYVAAMDHWNIGAKLAYPPYNAPYLDKNVKRRKDKKAKR